MLILAGVTIAALSGDNGILQRAAETKEKTSEAEKQEMQDIENMESIIEEYATGIKIEQVTDAKPGELEVDETAENTYIINSIEDLVFFAHDVTNGNNYEGETVKLGTSLDFNSTKSYVDPFRTDYEQYGYDGELKTLLTSGEGFKSIGATTEDDNTNNLLGTFDGNNNFIDNLYINVTSDSEEQEKRGLFANNYGTINNLRLTNVNLYLNSKNGHIAGISGQNSITGSINNCIVSGNIKFEGLQGVVGGVTCYCSGKISNCGNLADVYGYVTSSPDLTYMGGIYTTSGVNAEIINCYNKGDITGKVDAGGLFIGGIGGDITGKIKNCYNTGDISGEGVKKLRIGGISGNINNGGSVNSCYTTGTVKGNQTTDTTIGMIIGRNNGGTINNIYYKKVDDTPGVGEANIDENLGTDSNMVKTEEMKQDSFVDLLNSGNEEVGWKKDTSNINNGYPILKWQCDPTMGN